MTWRNLPDQYGVTEVPQVRRLLILPNLEDPLSDLMPLSVIIAADSEGFS